MLGGENIADTDINLDNPTLNVLGPERPCALMSAITRNKLKLQLSEYQRKQQSN